MGDETGAGAVGKPKDGKITPNRVKETNSLLSSNSKVSRVKYPVEDVKAPKGAS